MLNDLIIPRLYISQTRVKRIFIYRYTYLIIIMTKVNLAQQPNAFAMNVDLHNAITLHCYAIMLLFYIYRALQFHIRVKSSGGFNCVFTNLLCIPPPPPPPPLRYLSTYCISCGLYSEQAWLIFAIYLYIVRSHIRAIRIQFNLRILQVQNIHIYFMSCFKTF